MKNYLKHFSKTFKKISGVKFRELKLLRFVVVPFMALILGGFMIYFFLLKGDSAAAWFNDAWGYRVSIPVTNNTGVQNNVYIQITGFDTSNTSKFQPDCGDIRVTDSLGNSLSYYIVSGCGTAATTIQVQYSVFKSGSNPVYVYYGNQSVTNGFSGGAFSTQASNYTVGSISFEESWMKGPSAYWALNEASGTVVNDATGNGFDGNLGTGSSAPQWLSSEMCYAASCLQLDGVDDYIDMDASIPVMRSISFWVKSTSESDELIDLNGTAYISISSGVITATGFTSPTVYVNGVATTSLSTNTWSNVVITTSTGIDASDLDIGRIEGMGHFRGMIDEVKMYDFVLSAERVLLNYNSAFSSKGAAIVLGAKDQAFVSDGLVGYWPMDDNVSGDAQTIVDRSGNGNNGTTVDGANNTGMDCSVSGKFGTECNFDGVDDYINLGTPAVLKDITNNFSVSAWVDFDSVDTGNVDIFNKENDNSNQIFLRKNGLSPRKFSITIVANSIGYTVNADAGTLTNRRYHLVGTSDGNELKLYVDGVLQNETLDVSQIAYDTASFTATTIGAASYDGSVDEVRVYNRALSAEEVIDLYEWAPGPVGYWDFDEGSGTTVNDRSGNSNTATILDTGTSGRFGPGVYGSSYQMSGDEDADNIDISQIDVGTRNTVMVWVDYTSTDNGTSLFSYEAPGEYGMYIDDTNIYYRPSGTDFVSVAHGGLTTGTFYHLAVVRDGLSVSFYKNGIKIGSTQTLLANTALRIDTLVNFTLGSTLFPLEGRIDDARIYAYPRTQEQIKEDMNAGHPAIGTPIGSSVLHLKLDQGYGTIAHDSSPQGNNGSISGASWTNDGKFGRALRFNRSESDYVDVPTTAPNLSEGTISFWGTVDDATYTYYWLSLGNGSTDYASFRIHGGNLFPLFVFSSPDGGTNCLGINTLTSTKTWSSSWNHFLASWGPEGIKFYQNGVHVATNACTGGLNTNFNKVVIGSDQNYTSNLNGNVDDVQLYPFAVTEDQVALLYRQGKQTIFGAPGTDGSGNPDNSAGRMYCVPGDDTSCAAPVAEYTFNENGGTTLNDSSTNGYEGTLVGGRWTQGPDSQAFGAVDFDGGTEYVDVGVGPVSIQTVTFWINPDTTTESIINVTDTTDYISVSGGTITATGFISPVIYVNGRVSSTLAAGTWQHVTITTTTPENANNFDIGRTQDINYFEGKISQVRLYDYVRTPAQIAWEFDKGKPIAHYRFDECQGTTVYNITGKGNNGVLTIGASGENTVGNCSTPSTAWGSAADGKRNSGLDFDGIDDRLVISDTDLGQEFTISFWFKSDNNVGTLYQYIYSHGTVSSAHNINIYFNEDSNTVNTPGAIFMATQDANDLPPLLVQDVQTEIGYSDGTWHHLLMIVDSTGTRGYIDGALEVSYTNGSDGINPTGSIFIGARNDLNSLRYYDGSIDDLQIYNYAVTDAQIREIYEGGAVSFR